MISAMKCSRWHLERFWAAWLIGCVMGLTSCKAPYVSTTFTSLQCKYGAHEAGTLLADGDRLMAQRKFREAIMAYQAAIRIDSSFCDAYHRLGTAYIRAGELPQAIYLYSQADRKFPGEALFKFNQARLWLSVNKPDTALHYYRQMIQVDPTNYQGYYGSSVALNMLSRTADALEYLARGQQYDRFITPEIVFYEGILYYKAGQYSRALGLFQQVQRYFYRDPSMNYYLGMSYYQKGGRALKRARRYLQMALRLGMPVDRETLQKLGISTE